jgi:hypothetical protein
MATGTQFRGGIAVSIADALRVLVESLRDLPEPWLVSGSTAVLLHGVDVKPGDIDVESTAAGARSIGARLQRYEEEPVIFRGTSVVRSHFGRFRISGIPIEVMGDLQIRMANGWCEPFLTRHERMIVNTACGAVPIAGREVLAGQYLRFGLSERARLLLSGATG